MTLLIANIGTSDLAIKVKIDGNIEPEYLPIFEREEENVNKSDLTEDELKRWHERNKIIAESLCPELNVPVSLNSKNNQYFFSFREITRKIWEGYEQEKHQNGWFERICPGRILGVLNTAETVFGVREAYVFVTNQVTASQPEGHHRDTYYLFKILDKWIRQQGINIDLKPCVIEPSIAVNDGNELIRVYGEFFRENFGTADTKINEVVLIGLKGGTGQMQTALQMQAFSSAIQKQIFIDPQLSVKNIFQGKKSDCTLTPRWYHLKTQKYQIISQLLQRWDFEGARVVVSNWSQSLEILKQYDLKDIAKIKTMYDQLQKAEKGLNGAIAYFNLDNDHAKTQVEGLDELKILSDNYPGETNQRFPKLLNLYTQCCLLWQTDRIADFLTRMGSFYEETLHELIYALDGAQYFDRPEQRGDWHLKTATLLNLNPKIAQRFYELEKASENWALPKAISKNNRTDDQGRWVRPLDDRRNRDRFKLPGRPTKLNFVRALVEIGGTAEHKSALKSMVEAMNALDYWCVKRNQLIHGARGISKQRMLDVLNEDRQLAVDKQNDRSIWLDRDIENSIEFAGVPDGSDESTTTILEAMATICKSAIALMEVEPPPSIFNRSTAGYFDSLHEPYYLYSDIRDRVVEILSYD